MTKNTFYKNNGFLLGLMWLTLAGVLVGTLAFCNMSANFLDKLTIMEQGYIQARTEQGVGEVLFNSLVSSTALLGLAFLLGFSAVGQPFEVLIPLFRGMGLGASIAQVYATNGGKGFIVILFLIVPYATISSVAMLVGVRESILMSNILASTALANGNTMGKREVVKLYCVKFLVLEAVMAVASAIDCLTTILFAGILLK